MPRSIARHPRDSARFWRSTLAGTMAPACAHGPVLRGRIDGLTDKVKQAEANGAIKCAPRELALARGRTCASRDDGARPGADGGRRGPDCDRGAERDRRLRQHGRRAMHRRSAPWRPATATAFRTAVDKCPDERETYNGFEDEDGCPDDPDTDGERMSPTRTTSGASSEPRRHRRATWTRTAARRPDNDARRHPRTPTTSAPRSPKTRTAGRTTTAAPIQDNDADAVLDVDDFCPNTPGPADGERPGCPKKNTLVVVTAREIRITQQIQFDFNKATIKQVSFPILDAVRDVLLATTPRWHRDPRAHGQRRQRRRTTLKLSQEPRRAACGPTSCRTASAPTDSNRRATA